jgi:hypothetical protein
MPFDMDPKPPRWDEPGKFTRISRLLHGIAISQTTWYTILIMMILPFFHTFFIQVLTQICVPAAEPVSCRTETGTAKRTETWTDLFLLITRCFTLNHSMKEV